MIAGYFLYDSSCLVGKHVSRIISAPAGADVDLKWSVSVTAWSLRGKFALKTFPGLTCKGRRWCRKENVWVVVHGNVMKNNLWRTVLIDHFIQSRTNCDNGSFFCCFRLINTSHFYFDKHLVHCNFDF